MKKTSPVETKILFYAKIMRVESFIMLTSLEFRRQCLHLLFGVAVIFLLKWQYVNAESLFLLLLLGGILIFLYKKKCKVPLVYKVLHCFERKKHLTEFPGRGVFFYLLGIWLVVIFFPEEIAIAGIAILAFGDAVSTLVGSNFGKVRILFKPQKKIEGTLAGILAGFLGALFLTNLHPVALLVASSLAMFAEIPNVRICNFPLDDNLIIPLVASGTLNFIYFVLI